MHAGFCDRPITPPVDYEMPGGFRKRFAAGVLQDLYARCAYLNSSSGELAIVSVDCVSFDAGLAQSARRIIEDHTGIPAECVLIAATHTHTGGPTADVLMSEHNDAYVGWVGEQVATGVIEARRRAEEASIGWGTAEVPGIAYNRRWRMADGTVQTNPRDGELVEPAGPVDDQLIAVGLRNGGGEHLGAIVNFTCHSTFISGRMYSADYPGFLAQALDSPMVFLNGAMGDINQIDFTDPEGEYSGEKTARGAARKLADGVCSILESATWYEDVDLSARSELIDLNLRGPSDQELAEACRIMDRAGDEITNEQIYARELVLLDEMIETRGDVAECEIQVMNVGGVFVCASPLQPFCRLGLDIKQAASNPTIIATLANGCLGYVGPQKAYEEGGYELQLKRTSRLAPGSGERYVEATIAALSRL